MRPSPVSCSEARSSARLTLVAADDASLRPLAAKLLDRPRLLTRIRWAARDRELCHLAPYTSTGLERGPRAGDSAADAQRRFKRAGALVLEAGALAVPVAA
jgi:hypothetical protein